MRLTWLSALAALSISAAPAEKIDFRYLDELAAPKLWAPVESGITAATEKFSGRSGVEWFVHIDHFGGDAKHPMGWPRAYFHRLKAENSDWSAYDNMEFEVHGTFDDKNARKMPVVFTVSAASRRKSFPLPDLRDGKTHTVRIPVAALDGPEKIKFVGFVVNDSDYKHGAKITVRAGNFRLSRSSECRFAAFRLTTPAVLRDQAVLKLEFIVEGAASPMALGVPFQISSGGRVLRRETLPVRRGANRLEMDLSELRPVPGDYTLTAFPGMSGRERRAEFKVLSSPYGVKK